MAGYSRGRNVLVTGVVVLASLVLFVGLFAMMTGRSLRQRRSDMYVALPAAPGLVKGDAVLLRGVAVGEVRSLDFDPSGSVIVHVRLSRPVPLTRQAQAILAPVDMFGRQSLVLQQTDAGAASLMDGDTIPGRSPPGLTARIDQVTDQAYRLLGDTTVYLLQELLGGGRSAASGVDNVARELEGLLREVDRVLSQESRRLDDVLLEAHRLGANLGAVSDSVELTRIRDNLARSTDDLSRLVVRIDSASAAVGELIERLNRGEGSLGLLLTDPRLYENATALLARLDALIQDITTNPKRYFAVRIF